MADSANNNKQAQKPEKKKEAKQQTQVPKEKEEAKPQSSKFNVAQIEKDTPEFVRHRLKVLEDYLKSNPPPKKQEKPIKVTLPDGKVVDAVANKTTPYDIAASISKGLAEASVVAKVNDEMWDMTRPLESDCTFALFKFDSPEGKHVFWHSSAHILGSVLEKMYKSHLCVGPPLEEGFYYDIYMAGEEKAVSPEDFGVIDTLVSKEIDSKAPFERIVVPKAVALEMFKYNQFKYQILSAKVPENGTCTVYKTGSLIDPCKGPHLPHTAKLKGYVTTKNSSSYWQGKAENPSLQRIYGISFPDAKQLKEWQKFQEEAAQRDHRLIGKNQELFFFHPLSPGSCFFLPHGARVYNRLIEFIRGEYRNRGFTEVITPNSYNSKLWETSGHWANYQENMFVFKCEDQLFGLKPMNCPGHCLLFGHRTRSYKELPLRIADFGVLHRNELSGALTGLTRVRRFQQDDAHIFCRKDQIKAEIKGALDFMQYVYKIFGFDFTLELSTRPEKFLGDLELWNTAETQLAEVLDENKAATGKDWKMNPGDGAFYGPKIDIHIYDALKRAFQCATIQLDFQLPLRFGLEYTTDDYKVERPVIVHRAIFGSVERMLAILIEHTAGKWPLWLSPRQVIVCPISEKSAAYASEVAQMFHNAGFYVDTDLTDKKMQKKIRDAQLAQYNYILVVGEKEAEDKTVNVRTRDNVVHGEKPVQQVIEELKQLAAQFK